MNSTSNFRFPPNRWLFAISTLCLIWILHIQHRNIPYVKNWRGRHDTSAVRNKTMGLGAVLMAILPERSDQRDTASLLSLYTDIDITIIDGVSTVLNKTRPPGAADLRQGQIGCWRVHMNMMRYVVDHRLETALILEADADWDIRFKDQMEELARHMPDATKKKPYGTEWDMLYIGAGLHDADTENPGPVIRYYDETVGTVKGSGYESVGENYIGRDLETYGAQDHQRIIHKAYKPVTTAGYMVTLEGASRILYQSGLDHQIGPVDVDFMLANQKGDVNGLIVMPPMVSQYKSGLDGKDSDIEEYGARPYYGPGPAITQSMRVSLHDRAYNRSEVPWGERTDLTR